MLAYLKGFPEPFRSSFSKVKYYATQSSPPSKKKGLTIPLIGFYDAPDTSAFEPLVNPVPERHACVFAFYKPWLNGKTLLLTQANFGCGGAGHHLFSIATRSREEFVRFLVGAEGLKASQIFSIRGESFLPA